LQPLSTCPAGWASKTFDGKAMSGRMSAVASPATAPEAGSSAVHETDYTSRKFRLD
jgi:hypothetical protein